MMLILILLKRILIDYFRIKLKFRIKPRALQLPITSRCNSRCLTCNVWKNRDKVDINSSKLAEILSDNYFSKVQSVGINGGEPTLYNDLDGLLSALFSLPYLKSIYFISNSVNSNKLLHVLEVMKSRCSERGISFNLTVSVDGVGDVHNSVRGIPNSFKNTVNTIKEILLNTSKYCDNINLGCTVSKYNIYYLVELESYFQDYSVDLFYHLAVPNKRIGTFEDADYTVFSDERAKLMAQEFFFGKYVSTKKKSMKIVYFLNYYFLKSKVKSRLAICSYLYKDLTIDENLNLYLCATASEKIGNLNEATVGELIRSKQIKKIEADVQKQCDSCIHYCSIPNLKGLIIFLFHYGNDLIVWLVKYKIRSIW